MTEHLQQLVYYSVWRPQTGDQLDGAICEILATSKHHNERVDITGALLACNGWFLQVLEGAHEPVDRLYAEIQRDRRHEMVTLIGARPATKRRFPRWSLCGANLTEADARLVRLLGRHRAFSPPTLPFELALQLLDIVQQVQARGATPSEP